MAHMWIFSSENQQELTIQELEEPLQYGSLCIAGENNFGRQGKETTKGKVR